MKKTISALLASAFAAALLLTACGDTPSSASTPAGSAPSASASSSAPASTPASTPEVTATIKVGASPAPHAEILEQVVPVLAAQGIKLEIQEFSDYIIPNTALDEGSLDANFFQHLPYLENFNAENGTKLVSAGGIHIEPMGIYGGRQASLDDLADGALIGIPNDATNEGRALLLLEALGYITLKNDAGLEAVPGDIAENPKNLKFTELEAAQLPASLPDLDYAIINGNYAEGAGLTGTALANEGKESPYVNIVAVREGDESRPEIQALLAALTSDEVREFILDKYNGEVVPVF